MAFVLILNTFFSFARHIDLKHQNVLTKLRLYDWLNGALMHAPITLQIARIKIKAILSVIFLSDAAIA